MYSVQVGYKYIAIYGGGGAKWGYVGTYSDTHVTTLYSNDLLFNKSGIRILICTIVRSVGTIIDEYVLGIQ